MIERIKHWMKRRDNEALICNPELWLLRPYLLGFLVGYFSLLVAVALVVPLTMSIGSVVVITTSFSLLVAIVVFRRQFIYFTYRLGDRRLFRLFFTNTIAIFLLTFSIIAVPLILNFRVQIRMGSRAQLTAMAKKEGGFYLDINQVYMYLLQEEAGALSRKIEKASHARSTENDYVPADSAVTSSEYQNGTTEITLFQMVKNFENSYGFYDMDVEKSKVPYEFYKKTLDNYKLSVSDIDWDEAANILVARQRNSYLPLVRDSLRNPEYSKLVIGLAKCYKLEKEVRAMTDILAIEPIFLIALQLIITAFLSIMIFVICFWRKIIVVPMIVSILATLVILALMSIFLALSGLSEDEFLWVIMLGLTSVFAFGLFARPENKIQRGLMIMSNVIGTVLLLLIQVVIITNLRYDFDTMLLVAAVVNLFFSIWLQRHFIRKYVNLKFAPEKY